MTGPLAALFGAVLFLMFPSPCPQQPKGPTDAEKEASRIRIGMTKEQQAQIEAVYTDSERQEREIRTRMHDLYHQLYTSYQSYDFDRRQSAGYQKEILDLYKRRMAIHAATQEHIRRILDRGQFDRLNQCIKEHFDKMRKDGFRNRSERRGPPPTGPMGWIGSLSRSC